MIKQHILTIDIKIQSNKDIDKLQSIINNLSGLEYHINERIDIE